MAAAAHQHQGAGGDILQHVPAGTRQADNKTRGPRRAGERRTRVHPSQELALHTTACTACTACTAHRRPAPATHRISVISTAKAERPSSGESEEKLRSMKASGISRQLLQAGGRQGGTKEGEGETSSSWVLAAGGNVVCC